MGQIRGDMNLLQYYNQQKLYSKYCEKNIKEPLSSFLPDTTGFFDKPSELSLSNVVNDSLRNGLSHPIGQLTDQQLKAFRLHPDPLSETTKKELERDMSSPS